MKSIFNQSQALENKIVKERKLNKLINVSKSTVNESEDISGQQDINQKRLQRIERMKKEGIIDFSFEP